MGSQMDIPDIGCESAGGDRTEGLMKASIQDKGVKE